MEELVMSERPRPRVRPFRGVENSADAVEDATEQQQEHRTTPTLCVSSPATGTIAQPRMRYERTPSQRGAVGHNIFRATPPRAPTQTTISTMVAVFEDRPSTVNGV